MNILRTTQEIEFISAEEADAFFLKVREHPNYQEGKFEAKPCLWGFPSGDVRRWEYFGTIVYRGDK